MGRSLIRDSVRSMQAYLPPLESRNPKTQTLLDFNERSESLPEGLKEKMLESFRGEELQVYPSYGDLEEQVAGYAKVKLGEVLLTNGSDQAIDLVFRAVCSEGDKVFIPSPSFPIYAQCATIIGCKVHEAHYSHPEGFPYQAAREALAGGIKLIVLPNPNNPTGTSVDLDWIEETLKSFPETAVLIDECYFEYSKKTSCGLIKDYPNLFITRTFSKTFGLAALRIGYLLSKADNISEIRKIRFPYDVNMVAARLLKVALENKAYVDEYVSEVMKESKPLLESSLASKGVKFWKSEGNFLLVEFDNAKNYYQRLERAGILVRPKKNPEGKQCLRITVGSLEQTKQLIKVLF